MPLRYMRLFMVLSFFLILNVCSGQEKERMLLSRQTESLRVNGRLSHKLDSILIEDQKYRQQIADTEKTFGTNSKELKDLWRVIHVKDSCNLIAVTSLLDTYGWLGADEVGQNGNITYFLVIQHADLKTQEKYLPVMREAVKYGRASSSNLALLEDRVALGQGKKQIYGSQVLRDPQSGKFVFAPIIDEHNVNKRRASVGLDPIEEYAKQWNILYVLPK